MSTSTDNTPGPPSAPEAEAGLLACLLADPAGIDEIQRAVGQRADPFWDLRHRAIFSAICRLRDARQPIDQNTVYLELKGAGRLEDAGGLAYVAQLPDASPSAANLSYYLEQVAETWKLRRLEAECRAVIESIHANGQPADIIMGDAEIRLHSALSTRTDSSTSDSWSDLLEYDVSADPNCLLGYQSGQTTRYICRGYGAWLVGPSGIGKSSLAFQLAAAWAAGRPMFGICPTRPLRILVVQAENDRGDLAEQVKGIHEGLGLDFADEDLRRIQTHIRVRSVRGKIGAAWCSWLRGEIESHVADLVLVDPLLSFAGIDVSRQDQCSQFLRTWLDPVLAETGAALLSVHHTGKPKQDNGRGQPQTIHDRMYAGLGSSELVNWARAVMLIEPAGDGAFRLILAKRGKRAGATHPNGEPTLMVWLRHADGMIYWEQLPPPEEAPPLPAKGGGRPSKLTELLDLGLGPIIDTLTEPIGKNDLARKIEAWAEKQGLQVSLDTCKRAIATLVKNEALTRSENGYSRKK